MGAPVLGSQALSQPLPPFNCNFGDAVCAQDGGKEQGQGKQASVISDIKDSMIRMSLRSHE